VVGGGGMAGLCASIAALEDRARVTLEKGSRSGVYIRLSGGLIWGPSPAKPFYER